MPSGVGAAATAAFAAAGLCMASCASFVSEAPAMKNLTSNFKLKLDGYE